MKELLEKYIEYVAVMLQFVEPLPTTKNILQLKRGRTIKG